MIKPEELTQKEREVAHRTLVAVRERVQSQIDALEPPVPDDGTWAIREDAIGKFGNELIQSLRRWELILLQHKGETDGHTNT